MRKRFAVLGASALAALALGAGSAFAGVNENYTSQQNNNATAQVGKVNLNAEDVPLVVELRRRSLAETTH